MLYLLSSPLLVVIYIGMPKSERVKLGKCGNPNVWKFGFQHVLISDVWALKFPRNMSIIATFGYRWIGPKPNNFGPNCLKSDQFCPFCLNTSSAFRRSIVWILDGCPITEPSENGTEVNRPRTELVRILDVDCTGQSMLSKINTDVHTIWQNHERFNKD